MSPEWVAVIAGFIGVVVIVGINLLFFSSKFGAQGKQIEILLCDIGDIKSDVKELRAGQTKVEVHLATINGGIIATTTAAANNKSSIAALKADIRNIEMSDRARRERRHEE